jgi:hypothetical protein
VAPADRRGARATLRSATAPVCALADIPVACVKEQTRWLVATIMTTVAGTSLKGATMIEKTAKAQLEAALTP